ncbi:conjugal transfer protein [Yersinia similis]|uniref:conjugal transfer protein n=1 Tax=Yersinia similis TaxID=367190 RepID=UPI0004B1CD8F|nr:conjugal transfer protein [Yersinia similis]CFQ66584.1 putative type IV secretion system protein IcmB/DotO [Yersinia similis]CNB82574.1 putative type IV secretion system protein IcmB/DotO [Yersinia similis]
MIVEKILSAVESAIANTSRYTLGRDFTAYCDLRTTLGLTDEDRALRPELQAPYIFVTHPGDYASVYEIQGAFCEFDEQNALTETEKKENTYSFNHYISRLHTSLASEFKTLGHKLSFVFERDPGKAREELNRLFAPQFRAIRRLGIDIDDIIQEKIDKLTPYAARERAFLVVYTGLISLPGAELKSDQKRLNKQLEGAPVARYGQNPELYRLEGLKMRHDALVSKIQSDFSTDGQGVLLRLMDAHEVGFSIREEVDRNGTASDWRPFLPGDVLFPHGSPKGDDFSGLLAPHLNYQLFSQETNTQGNLVEIDGMWHTSLAVTLGPQKPETFTQLFNKVNRKVPFRVRFDLMPGGQEILGKKRTALGFLAVISSLRPIYESVEWLAKNNENDPTCVMTISASTWAETESDVKRNITMLQKAFQSWGVCEVTRTFGDPLRAWVNSIVGAATAGGANLLFPPLSAALAMLPLQRPATPWTNDANVVWLTLDGKLFPVRLGSSLQEKHTEIAAGEPGSGKSVLINVLNEVVITNGQTHLPFLSVIDKGYGAQGLIRMIRECLSPERQDEAVGIVLQNDAHYCRNPFDIQLGARYPLIPERAWLINILYALCIDPSKGNPPNPKDTRQILGRVIDEAYRNNAEKSPIRYAPSWVPSVDTALVSSGLRSLHSNHEWEEFSWYEVRDMLFEKGFIAEAMKAQYQAVPELSDLQIWLNHDDVRSAFGKVNRDGSQEPLLEYISRCLTQAGTEYRMLSGRTQFALNPNTRVVAIDLNNVMGDDSDEGHLRTGIMYLFAGQVASGDYILPQYADELISKINPHYKDFHLARIEQLDQELKTKGYDELHNAQKVPFIFSALETQDREQRKFAIRTVLSSQYLSDFPENLLKSANSLYLMRIRPEDAKILTEHFQVPPATIRRFMNSSKGAAADGSGTSFLAVFKTKVGRIAQILKNTVGPRELWALNSTPKDSALRNLMYEQLDGRTAREILAENFPTGSAEKLIELRQKQAGENDHANIIRRLADELIASRGFRL